MSLAERLRQEADEEEERRRLQEIDEAMRRERFRLISNKWNSTSNPKPGEEKNRFDAANADPVLGRKRSPLVRLHSRLFKMTWIFIRIVSVQIRICRLNIYSSRRQCDPFAAPLRTSLLVN
jgi:hypothetical protein